MLMVGDTPVGGKGVTTAVSLALTGLLIVATGVVAKKARSRWLTLQEQKPARRS